MSRAKSATASVNAKPKIPTGKICSREEGFLAIELIKDEKISPMPRPTPARATTARPAPTMRAASTSIIISFSNVDGWNHENKYTLKL